jgi:ATP-dependent helicase HrpA
LLFELQAIDGSREPTPLGRKLAAWPMDVRLARMVEEGARRDCLEDILVLAAAISIQDPRERPLDFQAAADDQHARFSDETSDFMGFLNLWRYLRKMRQEISGNQFRKRCRREFLNWQRVLEWFDLYQQLRDQARESRLALSGKPAGPEAIHRALLAGQLSHVGVRHPEDACYSGCRGRQFWIFPGSGLFAKTPKWLMSAEIVETTRPYARTNAVIQPEWIEEQAAHLLRQRVFEPHWSRRRGSVMAWEQLSLYGLVLVEKRRVRFAPHDPEQARRLFIEHALVRGELDSRASFIRHNERVREEVEQLEHKRRRKDVVVDERAQFEFFDARIPEDVNSARSLADWLDRLPEKDRRQLHMSHDVLMRENAGKAPGEQFPDHMDTGGQSFALSYHFEPGSAEDGVTLDVPLEQLNVLQPARMQWLVPGLLREKLVELMRLLPKPVRRSLTPIPTFADALLESVPGSLNTSLPDWMCGEIHRMTGLDLTGSMLDESALPDHLRLRVRVLGASGECLEEGRDLEAIQDRLGKHARRRFMDRQGQHYLLDGAVEWVFGDLSRPVRTRDGLTAWRAVVDQERAVGLRLFETRPEADQAHARGVTRLVSIALADKLNYLLRNHGLSREAQLAWMPVGQPAALARDLAWRALSDLCESAVTVRDQAAFNSLCQRVRGHLVPEAQQLASYLNAFLPACSRVRARLESDLESVFPDVYADVGTQVADLVYEGFLMDLWPGRLEHYPRYFKALEIRLQQLDLDPARDRQRMEAVAPWWRKYLDALERGVPFDDAMDRYRWLVEEYRVSLFAQSLGARGKVSPKRLREAWAGIG